MTGLVSSVARLKTPEEILAFIKKAPNGIEALKIANLCRDRINAETVSVNCFNEPFRLPAFHHIALSIDSKVFANLFTQGKVTLSENIKLFKDFILACYSSTFPHTYEGLNAVLTFSIKYQHCVKQQAEEQHIKRLTSYPVELLVKLYELAEKNDLQTLGNAIEFQLSALAKECKTESECAKLFSNFKGKSLRHLSVNIPGHVPLDMIAHYFSSLRMLDITFQTKEAADYFNYVYFFRNLDTLSLTFKNTHVSLPQSKNWKVRQLVIWRQNKDEQLLGTRCAADTVYCPSPTIYYEQSRVGTANLEDAFDLVSMAQRGAFLFNLSVIPHRFKGTDKELCILSSFTSSYAGLELQAPFIRVLDKKKAFNKEELPTL